jgi:hypothetical protein
VPGFSFSDNLPYGISRPIAPDHKTFAIGSSTCRPGWKFRYGTAAKTINPIGPPIGQFIFAWRL